MFLFAVGYSVGPQFVPALKKDGLPQVAFTLLVCAAGFGTAYAAAKMMGYDAAVAAGLLAGALTNSGTLGVATSNLGQLGLVSLFGVESNRAAATILVTHAFAIGPVILIGLILLWKEGLSFRSLSEFTREADKPETAPRKIGVSR